MSTDAARWKKSVTSNLWNLEIEGNLSLWACVVFVRLAMIPYKNLSEQNIFTILWWMENVSKLQKCISMVNYMNFFFGFGNQICFFLIEDYRERKKALDKKWWIKTVSIWHVKSLNGRKWSFDYIHTSCIFKFSGNDKILLKKRQ